MAALCKVLIVDDQTLLRNLLHALLRNDQRFQIVGDAADSPTAISLAVKSRPDLVLLDFTLHNSSGIDVLKSLRPQLPNCRFLVFSAHQKVGVIKQTVEAGAHGFIDKGASLDSLRDALNTVADGKTYFGQAAQELVTPIQNKDCKTFDSISPREKEVLKLIVEGLSTKQVADRLHISFKTADNHRTNLMKKLEVHDVINLTRKAVRLGMVAVE